jgi:hypothetical protein
VAIPLKFVVPLAVVKGAVPALFSTRKTTLWAFTAPPVVPAT